MLLTISEISPQMKYQAIVAKSCARSVIWPRLILRFCISSFIFLAAPTPVNAKEVCFNGNINNDNLELTNTYGTLQSPQKDSNTTEYPPDVSCDWVITVPAAKIVRLSFDRFDLEWSSDCTADYVEVLDGSSRYSRSKGRFCGLEIPEDVLSTGRYMRVRFRSDSEYSYYLGFKATFTAEDKPSKWKMLTVIINRLCIPINYWKRKKVSIDQSPNGSFPGQWKQMMKQLMQINKTPLNILTYRRQTSWLFANYLTWLLSITPCPNEKCLAIKHYQTLFGDHTCSRLETLLDRIWPCWIKFLHNVKHLICKTLYFIFYLILLFNSIFIQGHPI